MNHSSHTVCVCVALLKLVLSDDEALLLARALHWREAIQLNHRHRPVLAAAQIHTYIVLLC